MTKTKIMTMITFGASLLALGGQAFAEDVVVGETPTGVEVVETPNDTVVGNETVNEPVVEAPTETVETPVTGDETLGQQSETPVTPEGNGVVVEPAIPETQPEEVAVEKPTEVNEVSKPETKPQDKTPDNKQPSQSIAPGMISSSTGQVVSPVSTEVPIQTVSGKSVIGTRQGQVEVMDDAGNITLEKAENHGGKVNDDGTVTITKSDKSKVTLPNTGDGSKLAVQFVGVGLLLGLVGYSFKDKIKQLLKKIFDAINKDN
ncbi:LPXTG cell wall anchor domain-containing protein [Streptococcus pluranimalium]|uniref:LPXTG cell wall anchor domain-containing protein n=1 Tax=Streptococcus pluranimalium TaxID=82348 RepID=UPI0039FCBFA2